MKELRRNMRLVGSLLILLFLLMAIYFCYSVYFYGGRWFANPYNPRISSQKQDVVAGKITDRDGVVLAYTNDNGQRSYASSASLRRAVSHVVGDSNGQVANGVETFHAQYLLGFKAGFLDRLLGALDGEPHKGDDVQLTLSSKLNAYISEQFPGGKKGAVVVLNYKTGDILAMVSKPDFDPLTITDDIAGDNGELLNRATQGRYPPGSTFKIITQACGYQNFADILSRTFYCTGALPVQNTIVTDASLAQHGEQNVQRAFANSCNNAFAALTLELGYDLMSKTATAFGFNDNPLFQDLVVYNPSYPGDDKGPDDLAWSGVGQGRVLTTPIHMAMVAGAVANGGTMMEPRLLRQVTGSKGQARSLPGPKVYRTVCDEWIAYQLKEDMVTVVTSGTGTRARISGLRVGGKTGSAEASDDKTMETHAWYAGFIDDDRHPLAVAVLVEYGGSGGQVAAPLASKVLKKAVELGL